MYERNDLQTTSPVESELADRLQNVHLSGFSELLAADAAGYEATRPPDACAEDTTQSLEFHCKIIIEIHGAFRKKAGAKMFSPVCRTSADTSGQTGSQSLRSSLELVHPSFPGFLSCLNEWERAETDFTTCHVVIFPINTRL